MYTVLHFDYNVLHYYTLLHYYTVLHYYAVLHYYLLYCTKLYASGQAILFASVSVRLLLTLSNATGNFRSECCISF